MPEPPISPASRVIACIAGLPGLVFGALMMLSALGLDIFRLSVAKPIAFVFGLALLLLGWLFAGPALGLLRGNRITNRLFVAVMLLFLGLMHFAVIYGKSSWMSIGFVALPVQFPLLGYLGLAVVDGAIAFWLVFETFAASLPRWADSRGNVARSRVQCLVLILVFFALLSGADLLGLYGNRS